MVLRCLLLSTAWQYLEEFQPAAREATLAVMWARGKDAYPEAWSYLRVIEVWEARGKLDAATRAYVRLARRLDGGITAPKMHAWTRAAACRVKADDLDMAARFIKETTPTYSQTSDEQLLGLNLRWRGLLAVRRGRLETADEALYRSAKVSPSNRMNGLLHQLALSHLLAARGQVDEAKRLLSETLAEAAATSLIGPARVAARALAPLLGPIDAP